jgi:flagellar basal body-associated protein FliL
MELAHTLPRSWHHWSVAVVAPIIAAAIAVMWLGSHPTAPVPSSAESRAAHTVARPHAEPKTDIAQDGRQRVLRAMLVYGMSGRPYGWFK